MKTLKGLLVTSALAFGIAGFAQAQTAENAAKSSAEQKAEFGHKLRHDGEHRAKFSLFHPKLIEDLKLTANQKAKYDEIERTQKSLFEGNKEASQKLVKERKTLLSADVVDLKALLENSDKFHDEMMKGKDEVRAKMLAFWDSLDTTQKIKATQFLKEREGRKDKRDGKAHRGN